MYRKARLVLIGIFAIALVGCSDDTDVSSGGGDTGVGNDGGNPSAMYAGTYVGDITTEISGDEFDDKTNVDRIEILIRSNGTARVTIEGESVEGTVDGRQVGFSVEISRSFGLIDCDSDSVIRGTINAAGNQINGDANGSGRCKLPVTGSTGVDLTGTFYANKP